MWEREKPAPTKTVPVKLTAAEVEILKQLRLIEKKKGDSYYWRGRQLYQSASDVLRAGLLLLARKHRLERKNKEIFEKVETDRRAHNPRRSDRGSI